MGQDFAVCPHTLELHCLTYCNLPVGIYVVYTQLPPTPWRLCDTIILSRLWFVFGSQILSFFCLMEGTPNPDGRGECFQCLESSGLVHPPWVPCSVRYAEWMHRNRHQGTARCRFWPLLLFLLLKSKFTFLFLKERSILLCCPSWSTSTLSCLRFPNARVTDKCCCAQLTFVFCLSYFRIAIFFPF